MISNYTIKNSRLNTSIEFNEILFRDCIKYAKIRNKELYNILKKKYEELENQKCDI